MKFIEIKEGLSICIDSIVVIENVPSESSYTGFKTIVHTKVGVFESTFPYETLLDIINSKNDDDEKDYSLKNENGMLHNKLDVLINNSQKWVG